MWQNIEVKSPFDFVPKNKIFNIFFEKPDAKTAQSKMHSMWPLNIYFFSVQKFLVSIKVEADSVRKEIQN